MKPRVILGVVPAGLLLCALLAGPIYAADFLAEKDLKALGVQRYWHAELPLPHNASLAKIVQLDDTIYAMTDTNVVYAIHAATGIIRWSNIVADPGQAIRGPTHAQQFVFFTTPGTVRVMNRQSGESQGEPRALHGVVIDVVHDTATISIGEAHGVRAGDVFNVMRMGSSGEADKDAIARLQITALEQKKAKGRLTRLDVAKRVMSGDVVMANVVLPLSEVKLPFAASSAAVADETRLFFGAANQRFYSLNIRTGFQNWQLLTPKTVSATPVLQEDELLIAGEDGQVISLTKVDRTKNWSFETEGPIFADLAMDPNRVYVASSDRSLYCLDRKSGHRIWRERFDTPLHEPPVLCKGRLFQPVPQQGLLALDAETGKRLWRREEDARFLAQFDDDAYLLTAPGSARVVKVDPATGKEKCAGEAQCVTLAAASQSEQSIVLATKLGELACLRSEKAPRLTPGQLAEALRNDAKIQALAQAEAQQKAAAATSKPAAAEAKTQPWLVEEDWLTSRSKAKPVGGQGLVGGEEGKAGKAEKGKEAAEEKVEKGKEAAGEEEGAAAEEEEPSKDAAEEESTESEDSDKEATSDEEESSD
jgi:outer membrane protein assembly factor BamB